MQEHVTTIKIDATHKSYCFFLKFLSDKPCLGAFLSPLPKFIFFFLSLPFGPLVLFYMLISLLVTTICDWINHWNALKLLLRLNMSS